MAEEQQFSTFQSYSNDTSIYHFDVSDDARVPNKYHVDQADFILACHLVDVDFAKVVCTINDKAVSSLQTTAHNIVNLMRKLIDFGEDVLVLNCDYLYLVNGSLCPNILVPDKATVNERLL